MSIKCPLLGRERCGRQTGGEGGSNSEMSPKSLLLFLALVLFSLALFTSAIHRPSKRQSNDDASHPVLREDSPSSSSPTAFRFDPLSISLFAARRKRQIRVNDD